MLLQVQVLTQVSLSCVAAVVVGQCGAAESVREGVRAGISTELQREDSLDPLWHSSLPTPPAVGDQRLGRPHRATPTFLLALLLVSRLDLDFLSAGQTDCEPRLIFLVPFFPRPLLRTRYS